MDVLVLFDGEHLLRNDRFYIWISERKDLTTKKQNLGMADILITNGNVVTMDSNRRVIENGAIAIENELIIDVGESEEIEASHKADVVIDAEGHAVIPGLINTHTHVADILFRGGGQTDRALYDWLFNVTKPGRAEMNAEEHASILFRGY